MTKLPEIHPCICGQTAGALLNWVHPVHTRGYLGATKAQAIERWNAATDPDTTDAPWPHFGDFPFRFDAMEVSPR